MQDNSDSGDKKNKKDGSASGSSEAAPKEWGGIRKLKNSEMVGVISLVLGATFSSRSARGDSDGSDGAGEGNCYGDGGGTSNCTSNCYSNCMGDG